MSKRRIFINVLFSDSGFINIMHRLCMTIYAMSDEQGKSNCQMDVLSGDCDLPRLQNFDYPLLIGFSGKWRVCHFMVFEAMRWEGQRTSIVSHIQEMQLD